jgi:2,3-diketo-5-methylthiopentyl-1-phosphate enolase
MDLHDHVFAYPESVVPDGYVIATYYMEAAAHGSILDKAASLAIGQTIGTWTPVPGITAEMLERYLGKVVSVFDVPPVELSTSLQPDKRAVVLQIAFPEVNFGAQFPMILTTLLGNDVSTSAQIKLVDVQISPALALEFGGPRFGIEGLRKKTGVFHRPLILNVLKPCTGFPSEAGAVWFDESARGGSDVIKDDELLSNPSFNQLLRRVELYHQAAQRVFRETGHRTLYCANITDRSDRIIENGRRAVELGADLLMVNAIATGLGTLQAVAADPGINVPVLAHFAVATAMTDAQQAGLSSALLLGKFLRLAGADAALLNSPYSVRPVLKDMYVRTAQYMAMPLHNVKPTLPVVGGGVHPASAVNIIKDLGKDIMLNVGGAIQGHPGGSTAGAKAMVAALEALMEGISLEEKSRECPELRTAIEKWGRVSS